MSDNKENLKGFFKPKETRSRMVVKYPDGSKTTVKKSVTTYLWTRFKQGKVEDIIE